MDYYKTERHLHDTPISGKSVLSSLVVIAKHCGVELSLPQLISDYCPELEQLGIQQIFDIARVAGFRASCRRLTWQDLMKLRKPLPAVVLLRNGNTMVLNSVRTDSQTAVVVLQDPNASENEQLVIDQYRFAAAWSGCLLTFKRVYKAQDEDMPFGVRYVIRQITRSCRLVVSMATAAFLLSFLALVPIMFWRILIDRVLYYQHVDTLAVLCMTLVVFGIFETIFAYLRRQFSLQLMQRLDAKISTHIFDRMIQLPLDLFERTPAGKITHDVNEFYRVRNFLTSQIFGTALDSMVLLVFFPVMFAFQPLLTLIILGGGLLICGYIIFKLPEVRRKTAVLTRAETEKSTYLVETLQGARTVKAMSLIPRRQHMWDGLVAKAARARFDQESTANKIVTVIHPLERLMTTGVFALAVYFAISEPNNYSGVGGLLAFMMLAQRVTQPLVRLSEMVFQFDEARGALDTIGLLVNQRPEEGHSDNAQHRPVVGRVEFSGVTFQYPGTMTPALNDVSFRVPEGSIFGIMGRSGSGKTTVTRLLQMFSGGYEGLIKVDGIDLRSWGVDHLRSQFGVVAQENFLFSGTIMDTIRSAKPSASVNEVVTAARLAGAEEFIDRLPAGYSTYIYEGSPNLSGGQRQRLAIARALIGDPRILILDEATSALDAESEAIVNTNLVSIAEGRTMIVISHRLSSLVKANAILVLERGNVYDIGNHAELLERCDIYSNLWHQQHQHLQRALLHDVVPFRPRA